MLTGFRRIIKAGFVGFWRSAYVSFSSVFVLTIALFVIGSTIFIDQVLTKSLSILQSQVDINLYFVPDASNEAIAALRTSVSALPDVAEVTFTSKEEALAQYREEYRNDEIAMQALAELDENPLPASLAIRAQETSQYENIARFLEEQRNLEIGQAPVIDRINYYENRESIDSLTAIISAVEQASLIVMVVLLVAATLITFNTIRLAIYTAREEIAIMRLVGASNMFIRGPFMLQGIMYGLVSSILTMLLFYPMLVWLGPRTESFFELNLYTYYIDNLWFIFGVIGGIGVVLGLVSSILAIARYLRT
jgi:cell division transport system permease protein